jgi:hypothetical protein
MLIMPLYKNQWEEQEENLKGEGRRADKRLSSGGGARAHGVNWLLKILYCTASAKA